MKVTKLAIAIAIAGLPCTSLVYAQGGYGQHSAPVNNTAFEYSDYYAQDEEAAPAPAPSDIPDGSGSCCASACDSCNPCGSCDSCCDPCDSCDSCYSDCCTVEPWKLFDCPQLDCCGINIGGWIAQSFTWNPDDPADRFNGPVTFLDRSNEYQMNQLYLTMEKVADTGGCGFALGGRVDLLYGTDWRFTPALGLENRVDGSRRWNQDSRFYGLAMPQAYAEVAYNDLSVKLGHFYTIIGYEVVPATGNFFATHAYTMQYGEPFTHTGALASYALSDNVSVSGGFTRGWDYWEDNNDDLDFLGGVTLSNDNGGSVAFAITSGDYDDAGDLNRTMYSIVLSQEVGDWTGVLQHDRGRDDEGVSATQDAEWYGLNSYLFYTINDCWSAGVRAEWFRDDDGVRVISASTDSTGFAGDFYEITAGLNWRPHANVLVRPECRWDWYDGINPGGARPYDDGTDSSQFLLATDVIVTY